MKTIDIDFAAQMDVYYEECQDNLIDDLNVKREYILKALKEPITIENYRHYGLINLLNSFKKDIESLEAIRMYWGKSPF